MLASDNKTAINASVVHATRIPILQTVNKRDAAPHL